MKHIRFVFITVVSVTIIFLVVDHLSTYFLSHRRSPIIRAYPADISRQPKPYVMFGGAKNASLKSGERLNSLGYRGHLPSPNKHSDEFRIFVIGGSTIFRGDPAIPEIIEKLFKNDGFNNTRVYNFGAVSSGSGQGIARILFEISELEPDLIIMYNGWNDIVHPLHGDPRPGYPFNFIAFENNPILESNIKSYPRLALFLYGSNLLRYFIPSWFLNQFVPLNKIRKNVNYRTEEWEDAIASHYVNNLIKANTISQAFNAQFIAFFQPSLYYKDILTTEENSKIHPIAKHHSLRMRTQILSKLKIAHQNDQLHAVDLSDIFDNISGTVFRDSCHINQKSKVIVAKTIYPHVRSIVDYKI